MPNQRRKGQTFIGVQIDEMLLKDIDRARGHMGRSQFLREAIAEKLRSEGVRVPDKIIYPPDRAGGMMLLAEQSGSYNVQKVSSTLVDGKCAPTKKPARKRVRKKT